MNPGTGGLPGPVGSGGSATAGSIGITGGVNLGGGNQANSSSQVNVFANITSTIYAPIGIARFTAGLIIGHDPIDFRPVSFSGVEALFGAVTLGKRPGGLKNAGNALNALFSEGSIMRKSIIGIRDTLTKAGFEQPLTRTKQAYLFKNADGESVRITNRNGAWDVRVQNKGGNYLDEFGERGTQASTHGIIVESY